jgi:hypothetical protein
MLQKRVIAVVEIVVLELCRAGRVPAEYYGSALMGLEARSLR